MIVKKMRDIQEGGKRKTLERWKKKFLTEGIDFLGGLEENIRK
jgi:hypothetical protein